MACVHNQSIINELMAQINEKQQQITSLNINITKCREIALNHQKFNEKVNCVINNLEGNTVVAGVSYDQGKMTDCLNSSNKTISKCDIIIEQSQKKIGVLEREILSLESRIASLDCICATCLIEEEKIRKG